MFWPATNFTKSEHIFLEYKLFKVYIQYYNNQFNNPYKKN